MAATKTKASEPLRLGPYALGKRLGGGGMGDVYEAVHVMMPSRRVAIKLLKPHLADNPVLVQRFLREISALGGVKAHPNLVRAEFADLADNLPFLVMEYVEGIDLGQALKWHGTFTAADACHYIAQAARGLEAIHQAGLVHRDLKPSNLMLTKEGVVKILDLGLARLQMSETPADELTGSHCVLGTVDYTAPEQTADPRTVDIRADIYSLGCTLYKLLTGKVPFAENGTHAQKILAHASAPFPGLPTEVAAEVQGVLARMVAKRPVDRFACPAELVVALETVCAGHTPEPVTTLGEEMPVEDTPAGEKHTISYAVSGQRDQPLTEKRRWPGWAQIAMLVGALSIAISAATIIVRARDVGDPFDVDKLEPLRWQPLFVREPMKLIWLPTDFGHTRFEPARSEFFVNTNEMAYLKIGSTHKRSYKLRVTLKTTAYERVGLFFGYRTAAEDPNLQAGDVARLHYVAFGVVGENATRVLEHGRLKFKLLETEGRTIPINTTLKIADIPERLGDRVLEASVSPDDLVRVWLDNVEVPELAKLLPNLENAAEDFRGAFGIFAQNNSCRFTDAQIFLMPPSK